MKHDLKKRVFLVQKDYNLMNHSLVQRVWRTLFKNEKPPDAKVNKKIIKNFFEITGSVVHIPLSEQNAKKKSLEHQKKRSLLFFEGTVNRFN